MNRLKKIIVFFFLVLIMLFVVLIGGLLIYGTATDFQPPESENIPVNSQATESELMKDTTCLMIWNIGYCGLGAEMDFFYDGGKNVRPTPEWYKKYETGVLETAQKMDSVDFFMFQEVDVNSKRSYNHNQFTLLEDQLPGFASTFALNYNVHFVPLPFSNPLGQTYGGLATYSRYTPSSVIRHSFPGNFEWPKRVFMLDRCFMVSRFQKGNGKELVLINTHNSAYDDGGLKQQQMDYLRRFLLEEYKKGNYIVVGGDWNQCPPSYSVKEINPSSTRDYQPSNIIKDYLPADWQWIYDPKTPTNRHLNEPYNSSTTFHNLIDFYLISPNLNLISVAGVDLQFAYSDHQPVVMKVAFQ